MDTFPNAYDLTKGYDYLNRTKISNEIKAVKSPNKEKPKKR
jgi:hypothetical protein